MKKSKSWSGVYFKVFKSMLINIQSTVLVLDHSASVLKIKLKVKYTVHESQSGKIPKGHLTRIKLKGKLKNLH